jgi:hypothetical protein
MHVLYCRRDVITNQGVSVRTFFTALAFLVMLMAVIPAVKRSLYPPSQDGDPEC